MESGIAAKLEFRHGPVGLVFSNEKPEKARQFQEGKWGCVMFMLGAAARGETAVFDADTCGCQGGGTGLGFGNQYVNFPGGVECFKYFLSTGNDQWEEGRKAGEQVKPFMRPEAFNHFMHGERYIESPELVGGFLESLPMTSIAMKYVILKPLSEVDEKKEDLQVVIFLGNMDQVAALTVLANFGRGHNENVIFPFAAGCQSIGIYPYNEAQREQPRAVLGLNDISARVYLKRILKEDLMSFAVPVSFFKEMESNLEKSFIGRDTWKQLMSLRGDE
ncbi:MAG: DUF169 domain-containing protein [Desulfopila sp.]|jgi:uncharacterized protein (DUF169 family)|nr:DUF169 domain-containing protein [Desulfopila sp.]